MQLEKVYEPQRFEPHWAQWWIDNALYHVDAEQVTKDRPAFSLVIPPPNVTGSLHIGHMLNHTQGTKLQVPADSGSSPAVSALQRTGGARRELASTAEPAPSAGRRNRQEGLLLRVADTTDAAESFFRSQQKGSVCSSNCLTSTPGN
jgi:tRNA synthetases class I (I, L, M and V)